MIGVPEGIDGGEADDLQHWLLALFRPFKCMQSHKQSEPLHAMMAPRRQQRL